MQDEELRPSSGRDRERNERRRSRDRDREWDRERHQHRNNERNRDRRHDDHRDSRYRPDRYKEDKYRNRYRDRHERERERDRDRLEPSSRKANRSRSKSRDRRRKSHSRSRDRHHGEESRTRDRQSYSKERERSKRNLSVEIEQELLHLRKLSDMKAANEKLKQHNQREAESQPRLPDAENSNSSSVPEKIESKYDFIKLSIGSKNGSGSKEEEYVPEIQTEEERIEFQKKMQEKLQAHLAAEGKLYPKPKPSPAINSATGFANDGSFLEMFKKMQEQAQMGGCAQVAEESSVQYYPATTSFTPVFAQQSQPAPVPMVGRRRGGKILKTGIVKKSKPIEESLADAPNDAWNLYLQEVKKYKNASCDADSKTRPLVK